MFIRNCPDPELSLIFKCKPLDEWTAADVQIRLDEYQRESKLQQRKSNVHSSSIACHSQSVDVLCAHGHALETAAAVVTPPQVSEQSTQDQSLSRMIHLLERVLDQGYHQHATRPYKQPKLRGGVTKRNVSCEVCGDASHDTIAHCRMNRVCFNCYSTGHRASACSVATAQKTQAQQSSPDAGQQ